MKKFKKGQASVTRTREVADSLRHEAFLDSKAAKYSYLESKLAKNASDKQMYDRALEINNKFANYNRSKADRYENAANKAMANAKLKSTAGRDTPLPSSDGIIGTITNKISDLFK